VNLHLDVTEETGSTETEIKKDELQNIRTTKRARRKLKKSHLAQR